MASSRAPAAQAGPSSSRINPLTQPVPAFARTTRSMTSLSTAATPPLRPISVASASTRPVGRRANVGRVNGRWDAGEGVGTSSRAGGRAAAAATTAKGKERAPAPAPQLPPSPGGSGRPRKSARRSKEDGGQMTQFLAPAASSSTAAAGRRLPRSNTSGSLSSKASGLSSTGSSLSSLASVVGNENIPFMPEPEDEEDDDLNIQPSPRKKQPARAESPPPPPPAAASTRPADPPLSPSRRANPGVKRSRARAFDEPAHVSPPKQLRFETPRVPQLDAANPFYVSPRAASAAPLAPSPPPSPPVASTSQEEADIFLPSSTEPPSSSLEVLRLPSPPPVFTKKRSRTDSPAHTPLKSCFSSSPLRSGSSDVDPASTRTTPKKSKRVKLTPPGPETPSAAASFRIEDPAQRSPQDPTVSPKRMPPVVDLKVLAKKFRSPRKKIVRRDGVDDGEGALGIRDFLVALPPAKPDDDEPPAVATKSAAGVPQLSRFTGVPAFKLSAATPSRIPQPSTATSISRPRIANRVGGAAAPTLSSLAKATPKVAVKTLSTLTKPSSLVSTPGPSSAAPRGRSLYPSSLSTQPAATRPVVPLPSARKTSVPLPAAPSTSRPPSPRTVSAPVLGQGLSAEGRTAMKGLAESLAKLNVRRSVGGDDKARRSTGGAADPAGARPPLPTAQPAPLVPTASSMGPPTLPVPGRRVSGLPVSRRVSSATSAANTSVDGAEAGPSVSLTDSKSRASLASIAADTEVCTTLKGVVAFVDVKTAEGDEAGGVFMEMLKGLGAKVLTRLTESVTHIIFKGGRPTTLAFYRKSLPPPPAFSEADEDEALTDEANTSVESAESGSARPPAIRPKRVPPALVGIGWVIRCREGKARVSEDEYRVDLGEQSMFQKRRKSMQPKPMFAAHESAQASVQQTIDDARRRSMQFAPRVGSPLKKAFVNADAS